MVEIRDLYDKKHKLTGETIKKGDPTPPGRYIQVVMVFIRSKSGHYLVQRRSKAKNGLYATTGGHAKHGENSLQAICAEIKEELGLDVDPKELQLFRSARIDEEQVFLDEYYLEKNVNLLKLKLQKEEVSFVCWMQPWEIRNLFHRCKYMDNHYEEFLRLQQWLEEQKSKS